MNVYSDDRHSAVKFMLDQIIDIPNLLYMGRDFNIRDAECDPFVALHPAAGQALVNLADSLGLVHSLPELSVPTYFSDTDGYANLVIDLIFLGMSCAQVLHCIEPDLRWPLDHAPLLLNLPISPENIRFSRKILKCNSNKENNFLSSVTMGPCALNFSRLDSVDNLDLPSTAVSRVISNA